ncbi:hypothetical protein CASFOL_021261 [Castilleja foliolosa]|uniref:Uncharacterized protein n=1 Tax=Castilleja foliolosa TaxID=1961234 RepID=A0ABD3CXL2_9LAMI
MEEILTKELGRQFEKWAPPRAGKISTLTTSSPRILTSTRADSVEQIADMFFKEVVTRLVGSFNDCCRLIYGPGLSVLENSH